MTSLRLKPALALSLALLISSKGITYTQVDIEKGSIDRIVKDIKNTRARINMKDNGLLYDVSKGTLQLGNEVGSLIAYGPVTGWAAGKLLDMAFGESGMERLHRKHDWFLSQTLSKVLMPKLDHLSSTEKLTDSERLELLSLYGEFLQKELPKWKEMSPTTSILAYQLMMGVAEQKAKTWTRLELKAALEKESARKTDDQESKVGEVDQQDAQYESARYSLMDDLEEGAYRFQVMSEAEQRRLLAGSAASLGKGSQTTQAEDLREFGKFVVQVGRLAKNNEMARAGSLMVVALDTFIKAEASKGLLYSANIYLAAALAIYEFEESKKENQFAKILLQEIAAIKQMIFELRKDLYRIGQGLSDKMDFLEVNLSEQIRSLSNQIGNLSADIQDIRSQVRSIDKELAQLRAETQSYFQSLVKMNQDHLLLECFHPTRGTVRLGLSDEKVSRCVDILVLSGTQHAVGDLGDIQGPSDSGASNPNTKIYQNLYSFLASQGKRSLSLLESDGSRVDQDLMNLPRPDLWLLNAGLILDLFTAYPNYANIWSSSTVLDFRDQGKSLVDFHKSMWSLTPHFKPSHRESTGWLLLEPLPSRKPELVNNIATSFRGGFENLFSSVNSHNEANKKPKNLLWSQRLELPLNVNVFKQNPKTIENHTPTSATKNDLYVSECGNLEQLDRRKLGIPASYFDIVKGGYRIRNEMEEQLKARGHNQWSIQEIFRQLGYLRINRDGKEVLDFTSVHNYAPSEQTLEKSIQAELPKEGPVLKMDLRGAGLSNFNSYIPPEFRWLDLLNGDKRSGTGIQVCYSNFRITKFHKRLKFGTHKGRIKTNWLNWNNEVEVAFDINFLFKRNLTVKRNQSIFNYLPIGRYEVRKNYSFVSEKPIGGDGAMPGGYNFSGMIKDLIEGTELIGTKFDPLQKALTLNALKGAKATSKPKYTHAAKTLSGVVGTTAAAILEAALGIRSSMKAVIYERGAGPFEIRFKAFPSSEQAQANAYVADWLEKFLQQEVNTVAQTYLDQPVLAGGSGQIDLYRRGLGKMVVLSLDQVSDERTHQKGGEILNLLRLLDPIVVMNEYARKGQQGAEQNVRQNLETLELLLTDFWVLYESDVYSAQPSKETPLRTTASHFDQIRKHSESGR